MSAAHFGLDPELTGALRALFARHPGIRRVWIFGSHARGDASKRSDVNLAVDAPALDARGFTELESALDELMLVRGIDFVHWQAIEDPEFRRRIEQERQEFWAPVSRPVDAVEQGKP